jgi:hypothetical protein
MADDEDILVQVDGEEQTEHGEIDPAAELKRQFDELKAENEKRQASEAAANRRAAEERARADAAAREVAEARTIVADRELDTIVSGIAAAAAEAEAAEKDYAAAAEAGDFKKQAEAQRRMARAESRSTTLEGAKADLESRRANGASGTREQTSQQPQRPSDPFEDHVSKFTPRTADWMRRNRDWVTDPRKSGKLQSAHHLAVLADLVPDTDEYFAHVEKTLGLREEEKPNGQSRTPARRASPVVAPVNGGAGAHSSGGDNRTPTVTLSAGEARMAKEILVWNKGERDAKGNVLKEGDPRIGQPIGTTEYARRKLKMQGQGYYRGDYSGS